MVSFELDDFIRDKDKTYWSALLSDGRWVYQDDGRPGESEPRSWIRLRDFCHDNGLYVTRMKISFRSHTETMPEGEDGYFCMNRVLGSFSDGRAKTFNGLSLGPIKNGQIHAQIWVIPEIQLDEIDPFNIRDINIENNKAIIWNMNSISYHQIAANLARNPIT